MIPRSSRFDRGGGFPLGLGDGEGERLRRSTALRSSASSSSIVFGRVEGFSSGGGIRMSLEVTGGLD